MGRRGNQITCEKFFLTPNPFWQKTNHSNRAAAVTELSRSGVGEQKLVKITGHSNPSSLKPYLQLNQEHLREIIGSIRTTIQETVTKLCPLIDCLT
jgi:hypothetical protein